MTASADTPPLPASPSAADAAAPPADAAGPSPAGPSPADGAPTAPTEALPDPTLARPTPPPGDRPQPKNPLHGVTLEQIVTELQAHYGWEELGQQVRINCFISDPSVASSLKFLRRTPWARAKVESLYLFMLREKRRHGG
jgi:hypothetical protein